jgi:hypothetical protein
LRKNSWKAWTRPLLTDIPWPTGLSQDVEEVRLMFKMSMDDCGIFRTVQNGIAAVYWTVGNLEMTKQSKGAAMQTFGYFPKRISKQGILQLVLKYFCPLVHGYLMYNACKQTIQLVRGAIGLILSDQPMGNLITGILGPTATYGNRHRYVRKGQYLDPVDNFTERNPKEDNNIRQHFQRSCSTPTELATALSGYGLTASTPVLLPYFESLGIDLYRATDNCILHVLNLNVCTAVLNILVQLLNKTGRNLLKLILQALLPASSDGITRHPRVLTLVDNLHSWIGDDVDFFLPYMAFTFGHVLRRSYLKKSAIKHLEEHSEEDFQAVRTWCSMFTKMFLLLRDRQSTDVQYVYSIVEATRAKGGQLFGRWLNLPSWFNLGQLVHPSIRQLNGPTAWVSTAPAEQKHQVPKQLVDLTNRRNIEKQLLQRENQENTLKWLLTLSSTNCNDSLLALKTVLTTSGQTDLQFSEDHAPKMCVSDFQVRGMLWNNKSVQKDQLAAACTKETLLQCYQRHYNKQWNALIHDSIIFVQQIRLPQNKIYYRAGTAFKAAGMLPFQWFLMEIAFVHQGNDGLCHLFIVGHLLEAVHATSTQQIKDAGWLVRSKDDRMVFGGPLLLNAVSKLHNCHLTTSEENFIHSDKSSQPLCLLMKNGTVQHNKNNNLDIVFSV